MKKKTVKKFIYFPLAQRGEKTKKEKKETQQAKNVYRNVEQNANEMALGRLKLQTDTPTI